jgi:hypothetical protein
MELEPLLDKRLEKARKKANDIVNGVCETQEDFEMVMRFFLSQIYNIPVFSEYFENLTFDQLAFEVELHRAKAIPKEQKTSEIINDNKEEINSLFDDWVDEDLEQFRSTSKEEFKPNQDDLDFMQSGKFKE